MRDPKTVSAVMARIRKTDTGPEILLRHALRELGLTGYRLYRPLPGRPDISFGKERVAVFVDGCFWHQCPECNIKVPPKPYWRTKLARNVQRDRENDRRLTAIGWRIFHVWEHEIREDPRSCARRVQRELRSRRTRRRPV